MSLAGLDSRNSAINTILKDTGKLITGTTTSTISTVSNYVSGQSAYSFSSESGSYILKVLYFVFLFLFIAFLVLVFIHYTLFPVFRFQPGEKGYIRVPSYGDSQVYLTQKKVPDPGFQIPQNGDKLATQYFMNTYSFSVDIYVRKLPATSANTRLILYQTSSEKTVIPEPPSSTESPLTFDRFMEHMSKHTNMIMYLTETNDLSITFFCDSDKKYSIPYIKNIPLYQPFRITCVVEMSFFTVYLNGKHIYQRSVPGGMRNNFNVRGSINRFFIAPTWANLPTQTVFLHNFILWPRAITYPEVKEAVPALASAADFGAPGEENNESLCTLF